MKQNNRNWSALVLYGMLSAALLLLVLLGARLYRGVTDSQQRNDRMYATLAYVQSRVSAADSADGIAVRDGPEGRMLVLKMQDAEYEVRIYCHAENLVEETARCDAECAPDAAQIISACGAFDAALAEDGLLTVSVDGRTAFVTIRSEGETGE